jgi:hypothetical protein
MHSETCSNLSKLSDTVEQEISESFPKNLNLRQRQTARYIICSGYLEISSGCVLFSPSVAKGYFSAGPGVCLCSKSSPFSFPILEFCYMHDDGVTSYSDQVHRKAFLAHRPPGSPICLMVPHGSSRKGGG